MNTPEKSIGEKFKEAMEEPECNCFGCYMRRKIESGEVQFAKVVVMPPSESPPEVRTSAPRIVRVARAIGGFMVSLWLALGFCLTAMVLWALLEAAAR